MKNPLYAALLGLCLPAVAGARAHDVKLFWAADVGENIAENKVNGKVQKHPNLALTNRWVANSGGTPVEIVGAETDELHIYLFNGSQRAATFRLTNEDNQVIVQTRTMYATGLVFKDYGAIGALEIFPPSFACAGQRQGMVLQELDEKDRYICVKLSSMLRAGGRQAMRWSFFGMAPDMGNGTPGILDISPPPY